MKLSRLQSLAVAALLAVVAIVIWTVVDQSAPPAPSAAPEPAKLAVAPAPAEFPPGVAVAMPAPEIPPDMPPPKKPVVISPEALKDMDDIQFMLRDFRARLGGNPSGNNAEVMQAVMGGNPGRTRFGPPEGQQLNDSGELIDRWGVPYFFHSLSAQEMEIRSAGPDRTMYTTDDLIVK